MACEGGAEPQGRTRLATVPSYNFQPAWPKCNFNEVRYVGAELLLDALGVEFTMQVSLRKLTVAAITATVLALGSMSGAQAAGGGHSGGHWGGGHWGGGHWGGYRGWGVGVAAPYYWGGYGYYGPYAYEPYAYDYGPECYIRRRVVFDRFGHRHIQRVRVCY